MRDSGQKAALFLVLLIGSRTARAVSTPHAYFQLDSFSYSEPVPIRGYFNNWRTPFGGGRLALTYDDAQIGVVQGHWQVGFEARYDYELRFSPDTATLYYRTQNHLPLTIGHQYIIDLKAKHFAATGIHFGYLFKPDHAWSLWAGLSLLKGTQLTDGRLAGLATAISRGQYNYNARVNYHYSEDPLFKRIVRGPSGRGYSLGVRFSWRRRAVAARLQLLNVLGRMYWRNAPFTTATATSNTVTYDKHGYLVVLPVLHGVQSNENFVQTLPMRARLSASYAVDKHLSAVARVFYTRYKTFGQVGIGFRLGPGRLQALFDPAVHAVTLRYRNSFLTVGVTSDRLEFHQAHMLALTGAIQLPL